jgi:predicted MFS family arabinose efflux permease
MNCAAREEFSMNTLRERFPNLFAAALLWLACAGYAFFGGMPAYVVQMATDWHYTASQQGMIAMAEVVGNALGSLLLVYVIHGRTARFTLACGLLMQVAGNAAMSGDPAFWLACCERVFAGVGGGIVFGTAIRYVSLNSRADTLLPLMVVCQYLGMTLLTSVVIPGLGSIGASLGLCATMAGCSLLALYFFMDGGKVAGESADGELPAVHSGGAWLVLASIFLVSASAGVAWTFLESVGLASSLAPEQLHQAIGASAVPTVLVCLCMPMLLRRGWVMSSGVVLLGVCTAGALLLGMPLTPWAFVIGATAFTGGWMASGVAQYAMLPAFDPVGRHIALIPACVGIGSAVGSLVGGYLIDASAGFGMAYDIAAIFAGLAIASMLAANWLGSTRRAASATPLQA